MRPLTRRTLLHRVRDPGDHVAWGEFHGLYAPLLLRYARSLGLARDDAEEVRDECLALLARRMQDFEYRPESGRFQSWLYRLAHGKVVDLVRRRRPCRADTSVLSSLPDPGSDPDSAFAAAWRRQELRRALARALREAPRRDARAFRLLLRGELDVPAVCARLGMTTNMVYKARSRLLGRTRALVARSEPR